MTLADKSAENMEIVAQCLASGMHSTAVAGRTYYAVFQKLKHVISENSFDYSAFLSKIGETHDRAYSHGTIVRAYWDLLSSTDHPPTRDLFRSIVQLDELYNVRRKADYDAGYEVSPTKLGQCYLRATEILSIIDKLQRG